MQFLLLKAGVSVRRVCFAGVAYVMDEAAKAQLYEVLEQIISQENHLEFWYAGCYDGFETLALEYIQRIRKAYPSCKIEIVAVMDPLKYDHPAREGIPKENIKELKHYFYLLLHIYFYYRNNNCNHLLQLLTYRHLF